MIASRHVLFEIILHLFSGAGGNCDEVIYAFVWFSGVVSPFCEGSKLSGHRDDDRGTVVTS